LARKMRNEKFVSRRQNYFLDNALLKIYKMVQVIIGNQRGYVVEIALQFNLSPCHVRKIVNDE